MDQIKIFALGGLDEDGKNMTVVEINDKIFIVEAGIKYPETDQLGVEVIIPDFHYLINNKERIKGIFITHGHDDVMAALPYLLKHIRPEIYSTSLTATLIEKMCKEAGIQGIKVHRVKRTAAFKVDGVNIRTFGMTHSIADSFGVAIDTDHGYIVFTSEFIIDYDISNDAYNCDIVTLAEIGRKGVFALLCESKGVDRQGHTNPNHRITDIVEPYFEDAQGRIIITCYEQNLFRIIEIIELANKFDRKVYFYNDRLKTILTSVEKLGYYHIPIGLDIAKSKFNNDLEDVVIIVSGNGQQVFNIMNKVAISEDNVLELKRSDTVIIASPIVPGTEREATNMENELYKDGVRVRTLDSKTVYSMHASVEDIKMMLYLFKPHYYIPVKGEYRQLVANANIAFNTGFTADRILVLDNGQVAKFENGVLKDVSEIIPLEEVMIDGNDNLDASGMVLRDRDILSTDGAIIVGVVINHQTKEVIGGPDIQSRGVIYLKEADYILKEIGNIMERTINELVAEKRYENIGARLEAKDRIVRYVLKETGKRPMILPVIIEINVTE